MTEEDKVVAAIKAELTRQSEIPHINALYLYNNDDDWDIWGVDEYLDIRALARAVLGAASL